MVNLDASRAVAECRPVSSALPSHTLALADEIERLRSALYLADEGCNYTSLYNEAHEVAKIKADVAQKTP